MNTQNHETIGGPGNRPHCRSRAGSAAYMVLLVLMPLAALLVAFLHVGLRYAGESTSRRDDERAFHLAEAGLQEAVVALREGSSGAIADDVTPAYLGKGLVWVETEDVGNDLVQLRSIAMCGSGRVALELLVFHYNSSPLFSSVLFSNQSFGLSANMMVDSFDSTLGTYAAQLAASPNPYVNTGAVVQSNGDVTVESTVEVYGDVHPGQDCEVSMAASADVMGSQQPLAEERILDPVVVPVIASSGAYTVPGNVAVLPPGSYNFSSVTLQTGSHLTIAGPATIVMGSYDQVSNTDLVLDTALGPIDIYVTGDFVSASNSSITTTSFSAVDASLYFAGGPGQVVDLSSNADFYGTIYAPETTVSVSSNFEVFGAIAADNLDLASNVQVHFDEALLSVSPTGEEFVQDTWCPTDFPRDDLMSRRGDPFVLLGLDKNLLPSPGDAHLP